MKSSKLSDPPVINPSDERHPQNAVQLIWGIALVLMGIGVVFRVPVVMERMATTGGLTSGLYFLRFCFYLIAIILMGGGVKKIIRYRSSATNKNHHVKNV
ncbi:MAG: hypothetical protein Q7U02_05780 [Desulfosalsimonadaceae bacterium]|nr:hypothetical protein [Desulfosalsimonadaceae bacterium]